MADSTDQQAPSNAATSAPSASPAAASGPSTGTSASTVAAPATAPTTVTAIYRGQSDELMSADDDGNPLSFPRDVPVVVSTAHAERLAAWSSQRSDQHVDIVQDLSS